MASGLWALIGHIKLPSIMPRPKQQKPNKRNAPMSRYLFILSSIQIWGARPPTAGPFENVKMPEAGLFMPWRGRPASRRFWEMAVTSPEVKKTLTLVFGRVIMISPFFPVELFVLIGTLSVDTFNLFFNHLFKPFLILPYRPFKPKLVAKISDKIIRPGFL